MRQLRHRRERGLARLGAVGGLAGPLRSSWRQRPRWYDAGWVALTNSCTIFTKRSGWSLCGKCPLFGSTSTTAPGAIRATFSACLAGITASSLPHTTSIGIAWVR